MTIDYYYEVKKLNETLSTLLGKVEAIEKKVNTQESEVLMGSKEAARFLGVSLRTIMNYKESGFISFSKIGGKLYFKKCDLLKVVNDTKVN